MRADNQVRGVDGAVCFWLVVIALASTLGRGCAAPQPAGAASPGLDCPMGCGFRFEARPDHVRATCACPGGVR